MDKLLLIIEIAERNISIGGYDVAAFLAHQSVMKVPKTHYIDELTKELNLEKELTDAISDLTVDYIFSRLLINHCLL
jgi:HEPN domain-containing protein